MITTMMVGFTESIPKKEGILNYIHTLEKPDFFSESEYLLLARNLVEESGVLLINLNVQHLHPDEVVLLTLAYTNNTPIFGVGYHQVSPFLDVMVSNRFPSVADAFDHIVAFYQGK